MTKAQAAATVIALHDKVRDAVLDVNPEFGDVPEGEWPDGIRSALSALAALCNTFLRGVSGGALRNAEPLPFRPIDIGFLMAGIRQAAQDHAQARQEEA